MSDEQNPKSWLPPRWVVRGAWSIHRGIFRISGGRLGLGRPTAKRYGTMRLTTIGRRSGEERSVILGYYEDGPNLVTMAMNGWADAEPAWWLNLLANPVATVQLDDEQRSVIGRAAAQGAERSRLWDRWREFDQKLDSYAERRSGETAVVILEPVSRPDEN